MDKQYYQIPISRVKMSTIHDSTMPAIVVDVHNFDLTGTVALNISVEYLKHLIKKAELEKSLAEIKKSSENVKFSGGLFGIKKLRLILS